MQGVMLNPLVATNIPMSFKFSKESLIEQDVISGFIQSLSEVEYFCFATKLAMKHAITIVVMNSYTNFVLDKKLIY
jgi:hypothetical protein